MIFNNRWKLYEYINKNPNKVIVRMAIDLEWSCKKVQRHLKRLINDGLVKKKLNYTDVLYYPTDWKELINWDEFNKK